MIDETTSTIRSFRSYFGNFCKLLCVVIAVELVISNSVFGQSNEETLINGVPPQLSGKWLATELSDGSKIADIPNDFIGSTFEFTEDSLLVKGRPTCELTQGKVDYYQYFGGSKPLDQENLLLSLKLFPDEALAKFSVSEELAGITNCKDKDQKVIQWSQSLQKNHVFGIMCKGTDSWGFNDPILFRKYVVIDSETLIASFDSAYLCLNKINQNAAPVSIAGTDFMVKSGATATLDGSQSSDPEGGDLTYSWSQVSGPTIDVRSPNEKKTLAQLPQVASETVVIVSLTVSDGELSSADNVTITILANESPTISINADDTVAAGSSVSVDASESTDNEGDSLQFTWSQISGPQITLDASTVGKANFLAPELEAESTIIIKLSLFDGMIESSQEISIKVLAKANPFDALIAKIKEDRDDDEIRSSTAKLLTKIVKKSKRKFDKGKYFQAKLFMRSFDFLTKIFSWLGRIENENELYSLSLKAINEINSQAKLSEGS